MVQLMLRRLCFVFSSAKVSASIGLLYGTGVISTGFVLHRHGEIAWYDVWLILGTWATLSCIAMFTIVLSETTHGEDYHLHDLFRFQRRYASWSIVGAVASWVRLEGLMLLSAKVIGVEGVAVTRAVVNLGNPWSQLVVALDASWLVKFGTESMSDASLALAVLLAVCGASLVMILIALLGHDQLIEAVYGGRYMEAAWQMPIHWIGIGCLMVEGVITNVFKASGLMFIGYAPQTLGAILAVVIGLALVPTLGQAGVIYAAAASMVLGVTFCLVAVTVRRQKISH